MKYWLLKSEPSTFSIDDLEKRKNQTEPWDGVRNFQARNMIRDQMKPGDLAFFYHSSCETPGIVGIIEIVSEAFPDKTAFNPDSKYFDAKSDIANPKWFAADVKLVKKFKQIISLQRLKQNKKLEKMIILRRGNRLSITPITKSEWSEILNMSENKVV